MIPCHAHGTVNDQCHGTAGLPGDDPGCCFERGTCKCKDKKAYGHRAQEKQYPLPEFQLPEGAALYLLQKGRAAEKYFLFFMAGKKMDQYRYRHTDEAEESRYIQKSHMALPAALSYFMVCRVKLESAGISDPPSCQICGMGVKPVKAVSVSSIRIAYHPL